MDVARLASLASEIDTAAGRIAAFSSETPLLRIPMLDRLTQGEVYLKAECLQATGSFKIRGALNVMLALRDTQAVDRVIAFSSGNHGIGVAYAGRCLNMTSVIVVPQDAPATKVDRIRKLGAEIVFYDRNTEDREEIAARLVEQQPAPLVKPYDDWDTIAGQGTCGLEALRQSSTTFDSAIVCTGGGGLAAGIGTYLRRHNPDVSIFTAEPAGWDDHRQSFTLGSRTSATGTGSQWCDGLLAPVPGELTFRINQANQATGLTASDSSIVRAMLFAWQALGLRLEPSGAVALACLLANPESFKKQRLLLTLTGGNVDDVRFSEALALAREAA
jgi:threonine dehydratase